MVLSKTRNCSAGLAEVSTFGMCFMALLNSMLLIFHGSAPEQLQLTNAQVGMVLSKTRNCSAGFAEVSTAAAAAAAAAATAAAAAAAMAAARTPAWRRRAARPRRA